MACCGLQCGLGEQAGFLPPHTGHCLRDEQRDTSCGAASHLLGRGNQGSHGKNWRTPGSPLFPRFQAPYCVEPAAWRGPLSSGHFSPSPSLLQGPKMSINLRPPSSEHWNIDSNLILTLTIDTYQQWREARWVEQDPEGESVGAEASPKEAPAPKKAPQVMAGGSKVVSPTETTHQAERDLETTLGIIERIHALRLQILHEMGGVRELEQAAIRTLMAEFARLQSILCEDLTKSLSALRSELEASSEVLSADLLNVLNLHPGDLAFPRVKELIHKHHQSVSMKVNLPLIELEVAREDLERFLQGRLLELSSDPKAREVVEEISQILSSYARRVRETILVPGIEQPGVFNRVVLALAVDQPVEAVLLPGILDGLSGRLGLMPPGVVDPPTSAREGISRRWAATLREAVMKTEGREVNPDRVTPPCGAPWAPPGL